MSDQGGVDTTGEPLGRQSVVIGSYTIPMVFMAFSALLSLRQHRPSPIQGCVHSFRPLPTAWEGGGGAGGPLSQIKGFSSLGWGMEGGQPEGDRK